ncbi:MAG: SDR family oxidoreductase [Planctomycetota bacterium]|nr:SDR family oxidoreductase [Planctomycetota bacterium]MDA0920124.1 SDR family oxidoreductase [Planctomycetota bacterium]
MDFLQVSGRNILVMGVANRKSVAYHSAKVLADAGANVIFSVRSEQRREAVQKLFPDAPCFVCDVEDQIQIDRLRDDVTALLAASSAADGSQNGGGRLHGIVHSIAFADYSAGWLPFHETPRPAFLQAINLSCYSLIAVSNAFRELLDKENGSVVTISISTTRMAAENYGYMAPVKAALDSSICFLAKAFSKFSHVRFNAVCPGLLKSSASAGIPGYVDSYLYAEEATLRKKAVQTDEVADTVAFLLSPRSSGINAQGIVIDAGMSTNYFDADLVNRGN